TTTITATTPAGVNGPAVVAVTNQVGRAGRNSSVFAYAGCSLSLSPTAANVSIAGSAGSVIVTTQAGCGWTAVSNSAFITLTGDVSGSGPGSVPYAVAATAGGTRTASIAVTVSFTVSGSPQSVTQTFAISQGPCVYALSSSAREVPSAA